MPEANSDAHLAYKELAPMTRGPDGRDAATWHCLFGPRPRSTVSFDFKYLKFLPSME